MERPGGCWLSEGPPSLSLLCLRAWDTLSSLSALLISQPTGITWLPTLTTEGNPELATPRIPAEEEL